MDSTETGNYNTAVGYGAECNFPSGSYNTILGAQAYVGGNLSGANNTVLGARVNAFGNRSNHIYLGDGSGNMRLVFNDSGDAVLGGSTTYPTFSGFKLDVLGSGRFSQALTLTTIATPRQRVMKFPVYCFDIETDRYNVVSGYEGKALARLQLLEGVEIPCSCYECCSSCSTSH